MRCSGSPPLANLTDLPPNPEIDVWCRILNMDAAALSNCMVIPHTPEGGRFCKAHTITPAYIWNCWETHFVGWGPNTYKRMCTFYIGDNDHRGNPIEKF